MEWKFQKLKEVAQVTAGQSPEGRYYNNDGKGMPFYQGKKEFTEKYIGEPVVWTTKVTKLAQEGDVLMSVRAPVGPVNFATQDCCIGRGLASIRVHQNFNNDFLFHFFKHVENKLVGNTGAVFNSINKSQIEDLEIPIPSFEDQQKIVEKLDKAFELIDQAKVNIERNIQNAKELFQSKLDEVMNNKIEGWRSDKLVDITSILGDGLHGTPKYTDNGEYFFINGNNLSDRGIVIKENTKRVSYDEFYKYRKELNDRTIFVSINGTLGNVSFYNGEKILLGKSACYFNLLEGFDKEFLMFHFKAPRFIKYAHKEATGATIKNVSLKSMRNFVIHYPDLPEQKAIVIQLNNIKLAIDNLLNSYQQKLSNLEELRKSILEKAFKGELTN